MNGKINLDKLILQQLYKKNKDYLIPIITIIVCFILLVQVTIPQIGLFSKKQAEISTERIKLETLNNNFSILSCLDDSTLNSQFDLAVLALPSEKKFESVLNAINLAASKTGVFLGDFEFQVGDLSKTGPGKIAPSLKLTLLINGGASETVSFVKELYKSLPLSEVSDIQVNNKNSTISISFYYKPFASVSDNTLLLSKISKPQLDLLNEISSWNNYQSLQLNATPTATKSATATSPF